MPPQVPFILTGTVTGGSTSFKSFAFNVTQNTKCIGSNVDDDGHYLIDLANCGYAVGDVVYIKVAVGNRIRISSITITQAMIDAGGTNVDLTIIGIRQHAYLSMFTLLNANKPSSFTDNDGDTITWTITSAFPEDNPSFPCVVINPVEVSHDLLSMDSSESEPPVLFRLEYFSKVVYGKERIDNGRDSISQIILDNESLFEFQGFFFEKSSVLEDSNVDNFDIEDENLNIATQIVNTTWQPQ